MARENMKKTKAEWIELFRLEAEKCMPIVLRQSDRNKKSDVINKAIKQFTNRIIDDTKRNASIAN